MLSRFSDWPARLEVFLTAHHTSIFRYGRFDCALFVADAIQAMTGTDLAAEFRDKYRTRAGAFRRARSLEMGLSVQLIAERLAESHALPEIPVLRATRGDMVLIRRPKDYSLGL